MASITEAILALDPNCQFVLRGAEPTDAISFNAAFSLVVGVDEANDTAILSDDPDDWEEAGITWGTVKTKLIELNEQEPMKLLREERNRRIAETDWWASSDLIMSAERTAYRQALRDITKTYSSLDEVVWPNKPE
tara:strand:+ start:954 stop:1358 length:405 start_codon:yes stop_codon:yes gene_type:complete